MGAVIIRDLGNIGALDVLVTRAVIFIDPGRFPHSWNPCICPLAFPSGIS
jgi:hypothetical protein